MARRDMYRYTGYQGRRTAGGLLKHLLAALVLLLILAALALLIGQRYIVYTDEGIRLELPFLSREPVPGDESVPVDVVDGSYILSPTAGASASRSAGRADKSG